jgi:small GTP-binding protein
MTVLTAPQEAKLKICLIGEQAVGKTTLVYRFVKNEFREDYLRTLGTQVSKKSLTIQDQSLGEVRVDMMVWDIMGEKGFMDLVADAYFYGASGILAVFDITRPETASALERWVVQAMEVTGHVPLVILGNKRDLLEEGQAKDVVFPRVRGEAPLDQVLTSAKTGDNVEKAFNDLAKAIIERRKTRSTLRPSARSAPYRH